MLLEIAKEAEVARPNEIGLITCGRSQATDMLEDSVVHVAHAPSAPHPREQVYIFEPQFVVLVKTAFGLERTAPAENASARRLRFDTLGDAVVEVRKHLPLGDRIRRPLS